MGQGLSRLQQTFVLIVSSGLFLGILGCEANHTSFENSIPAEGRLSQSIIQGSEVSSQNPISKNIVFLVNLETNDLCTATLISKNHALTAAHCLAAESASSLYLFFSPKPDARSERRQVTAFRVSPYYIYRYRADKDTGDIAIVKFAGASLPEGYEPASLLPSDSSLIKNGATTLVAGYGISNEETGEGAGTLRSTSLKISDIDYSSTEILLDQSQGSSVCHGDSGGPAFIKPAKGTRYYLWGVAIKGIGNEGCRSGVLYTNALVYKVWIENTLLKL